MPSPTADPDLSPKHASEAVHAAEPDHGLGFVLGVLAAGLAVVWILWLLATSGSAQVGAPAVTGELVEVDAIPASATQAAERR